MKIFKIILFITLTNSLTIDTTTAKITLQNSTPIEKEQNCSQKPICLTIIYKDANLGTNYYSTKITKQSILEIIKNGFTDIKTINLKLGDLNLTFNESNKDDLAQVEGFLMMEIN